MTNKSEAQKPGSFVGTLLFGLAIVFLGILFIYVLLVAYGRAKETRSWNKVSAKILRLEIIESRPTPNSPIQFTPVVEYEYLYGDVKYIGAEVDCWVNPNDPSQALLKHGTLAPLYTVWFPGLFVIAGLGIIINAFKRFINKS